MQRYVDGDILAGVSWALLEGRDIVDMQAVGFSDRETQAPLRFDHIFRAFSNTKLVTSCAIMLLVEEGKLRLDDPIEAYIPQLGNRRVLKAGAADIGDTEPARRSITVRDLLSHQAGLSYGIFDPGTPIFTAYNARKVLNPLTPLADMIDQLEQLPLIFHPGENWEYSVATDVLGRLVEVVSGQAFDAFIKARIFDPLGMVDTGFYAPPEKQDRLVGYYKGADLLDPTKPGLTKLENSPYPGAYLQPLPRLSGGGGLVTTMSDMIALIRALLPGGPRLLKDETIDEMMRNQLPGGQWIRFAMLGAMPGKAYGLGGAVTAEPGPLDPPSAAGEFQWGGVAGTHWFINPRQNVAGVVMAQRYMAFWNPFFFDFKRQAYAAMKR
ncbi:MAG: beta-lactamase family protein [Methylobacteriaceae bacterium]|nr:beta-lactamase family protein [Rhodoblastus sp.]MCC0004771.1 beta-lactamase family protein [Methylobacteriaceae bacterium]MCC0006398.1 beta-lactamase family protein [Methylobacteriaceae bacterium]